MLVTAIGDEILSPTSLPQNNHSQKIYIGRIAICLTFIFSLRDIFPNFGRVQRGGERIETFFSLWMWHHAGSRTTDHCTETIVTHHGRRMISHKSKFFIILVFYQKKYWSVESLFIFWVSVPWWWLDSIPNHWISCCFLTS